MNKKKLKAYAKLIARRGLNVKKGQDVIVQSEIEQLDFVGMVVEELYKDYRIKEGMKIVESVFERIPAPKV